MRSLLNRRSAVSAAANALFVAGVAAAGNGLLRAFAIDQGGGAALRDPAFEPPGWVIGAVWVGLFALLGLVRWRLAVRGGRGEGWVWALIALCFLYPYYTNSFSPWPAFLGAVAALAATVCTAARIRRTDRTAALLLLPLGAWTAFATVLTATTLAIN